MPDKNQPGSKAQIEQAWREFVVFLKRNGARITQARRIVFDNVMQRHDHFRADDLAAQLAVGRHRVSRGTVYRTLALMTQAGLVRSISDGDSHAHYEHIFGHPRHEHMICEKCGRFIEFESGELQNLIRKHCEGLGLDYANHSLSVFVTCSHCSVADKGETA